MNWGLKGKTALVTGASQGIGKATAKMLAEEGVTVIGVARRIELIKAMAKSIDSTNGGNIIPVAVDFSLEGDSERLAQIALNILGHVDILINSAGGSRPIPFDATHEQWLEGMTLNFFRIRELTHALIPQMKDRNWGRVVTFTGTSEPRMLNAAFTAKAAVHVWAKALSREVAPYGITINCLQPGRIRTEQIQKRYPTLESELEYSKLEIPIGRFGTPEEIASVATFFSSPLSSYVTGTVIPVDGGSNRFAF